MHNGTEQPGRRVAVVGGGVTGLSAALALSDTHRVTLFEAAPRLGGHARTVLAGRRGDQPVDTGFIVYNRVNYPNLVALFERLDVPVIESDMSFAASIGRPGGRRVEYSTQTVGTMFAQRSNLLSPRFLRMVRDVLRFNARAVEAADDPGLTLAQFLDRLGLGAAFRDWYLGPISGAIWSTPRTDVLDFPAQSMIRFFENHNLLSHTGQHQWYTVAGGSVEYVRRLETALRRAGVSIRVGAPVAALRTDGGRVGLRAAGDEWDSFDDVVLATHSDISHAFAGAADPDAAPLLADIRYQPNRAVLHRDDALMPRRRACWASWNYVEESGGPERLGLTYWMNRLQSIPADDPLFVTLNPQQDPHEAAIYDETTFRHPVFDLAMMRARTALQARNGRARVWYCGAWTANGFHEDGCASGLAVARAICARDAVAPAAPPKVAIAAA